MIMKPLLERGISMIAKGFTPEKGVKSFIKPEPPTEKLTSSHR
jgi:hypothetical protein